MTDGDKERTRFGIVGFGIMGERFLRAALAHPEAPATIAGVWDPSPDAAARLAALAPEVPFLPDAAAVIRACECLYIATPPAAHLELAQAGFDAGRAVLLEKPLSHDTAGARIFVDRAEAHGERAAVNYPMASSPAVGRLAGWLEEGVVGTPTGLDIAVAFADWPRPWQRDAAAWLGERAEGGFTREVVSHFLFLTLRLVGPLRLESARTTFPAGGGAETAVRATLGAGNIQASLRGAVGGTDREDTNLWTLRGTGGAIRLRDWSVAEREVDGIWIPDPDSQPNERTRLQVLAKQIDRAALLTEGHPHALATLREALQVQTVVEQILANKQG